MSEEGEVEELCCTNEADAEECEPEPAPELIDPQTKLREQCLATQECCELMGKLMTCNDRVRSKTKTSETCVEEMLDYMHCVDTCVAKTIMKHLK